MQKNNELFDLLNRICLAIEHISTKYTEPPPKSKIVTGPFETREHLCAEVRMLWKQGFTGKQIAARFGISGPTVSRILHGDKKQEDYK